MVKITIKAPRPEDVRSESESEEEESSDEEAVETSSRSSSNRSKRKCVLKVERKRERQVRAAASRSKSATPETTLPVRQPKKMFTCQTCSKAFHSNFVLKVHLRAHRKVEANPEKCDKYYHYYYHSVN